MDDFIEAVINAENLEFPWNDVLFAWRQVFGQITN